MNGQNSKTVFEIKIMKKVLTLWFLVVVFFCTGFRASRTPLKSSDLAGVYGVCYCAEANDEQVSVRLSLFGDMSYHYIDNSSSQKLNIRGRWEMKGNSIRLVSEKGTQKFHVSWKAEKKSPCIKSRKGLTFYRLCNVEKCN